MKGIFTALLTLTLATVWFFNFSAGIVGGIWLALTGDIGLVLAGLLFDFLMPFAYSIAFLPTLLLMPLIARFAGGGHRFLVSVLAFILSGYNNFILVIWVGTIFDWLIYQSSNSDPKIALWLWGYAVVMGPISYMASKEGPDAGAGTSMGVLFTQLAYLTLSINLLFGASKDSGFAWLWLLLLVFTGLTAWMGFLSVPKKISNEVELASNLVEATAQNASGEFCTKCGYSNKLSAKYCKECGGKL